MSKFFSRRFSQLKPYVPGEQLREEGIIKLNTNEFPYPPAPQAAQILSGGVSEQIRLYGDPNCSGLKTALAEQYGVSQQNIFVGNGSDEVLSFCFMAFCDGDVGVSYPDISYGFYSVYSELYGLRSREIPLTKNLEIRPEDYFQSEGAVVIANPNAPTGLSLSKLQIEEIVKNNPHHVVVIDEAYVDFGGESSVELIKKYDNLIVVQTFSKSRGFAGGRLGFAIADPGLIGDLEKLRFSTNPYNVNSLTAAMGVAILENQDYYDNLVNKTIQTRDDVVAELKNLGFICNNSKTNFVFAAHPQISGRDIYSALRQKKILVRHFASPRIDDYVRITIGTEEQMIKVLNALKEMVQNETSKS